MKSGDYDIAVEPSWADFWRDARDLAYSHFNEVDGGVEPRRKFQMDHPRMIAACEAGMVMLVTGRRAGVMAGYFTWNLMFDVESEGLFVATQGAWYTAPGHFSLGVRMFDFSVDELRRQGVQCIFPHHRTQGRGAHIGRFFAHRGAVKIQDTYCLWIGEG